MQPRFVASGPIATRFLDCFGFAAIVSPWRTVYILPEYFEHEALRRHEAAHLAQMQRDGWFRFWVQCLAWYFVPGYKFSPYEIEARECERDPEHPLLKGVSWC